MLLLLNDLYQEVCQNGISDPVKMRHLEYFFRALMTCWNHFLPGEGCSYIRSVLDFLGDQHPSAFAAFTTLTADNIDQHYDRLAQQGITRQDLKQLNQDFQTLDEFNLVVTELMQKLNPQASVTGPCWLGFLGALTIEADYAAFNTLQPDQIGFIDLAGNEQIVAWDDALLLNDEEFILQPGQVLINWQGQLRILTLYQPNPTVSLLEKPLKIQPSTFLLAANTVAFPNPQGGLRTLDLNDGLISDVDTKGNVVRQQPASSNQSKHYQPGMLVYSSHNQIRTLPFLHGREFYSGPIVNLCQTL